MSRVRMILEDDDNQSVSSITNSDDEMDISDCCNHRSCSRYGSCNSNNHQLSSMNIKSLSKNSQSTKGDIRIVDNQLGYQQKFDGMKWRRICSIPNCLTYLNGGVFYQNWLCGKHYSTHIPNSQSTISINSINTNTTPTTTIVSTNDTSQKSLHRANNKKTKSHKRGDIIIDDNGIRQKYNGSFWRPICNYNNCKSFMVARGYCHRHDVQIRNEKSTILSSLNDPQPSSKSSHTKSIISPVQKPKRGDIQCIRQQWNGTKWYSLCHYYTQDCPRRSGGVKCAYLCEIHYKEYLKSKKDQNLIINNNKRSISPRVKRKKSVNNDSIRLSNHSDTTYQGESTIDKRQHSEQCIQTELTYPLDTNDLRQGCFLIEDDNDDECHLESSQLPVNVKKEEDFLANKRKFAIDVNSLSMNCKIEITKLEF